MNKASMLGLHKHTATHEPRDVSRFGSEYTTKAATIQEDSEEFVPSLYEVGLGPVVTRARVLVREVLDRGAQAAPRSSARCAP
jgi:hypothetical protein